MIILFRRKNFIQIFCFIFMAQSFRFNTPMQKTPSLFHWIICEIFISKTIFRNSKRVLLQTLFKWHLAFDYVHKKFRSSNQKQGFCFGDAELRQCYHNTFENVRLLTKDGIEQCAKSLRHNAQGIISLAGTAKVIYKEGYGSTQPRCRQYGITDIFRRIRTVNNQGYLH